MGVDGEVLEPGWSAHSVEEFGREIEPRLAAIARREKAPGVMPLVMAAWGFTG